MSGRTKPPFRADHVGSLIRPATVRKAHDDLKAGKITADAARAIEDEAIREVVRMQEDLGLQGITDGELRRDSWFMDFFYALGGLNKVEDIHVPFKGEGGDVALSFPAVRATGKISLQQPIFADHFEFLKSVTKQMPKLTVPSPSLLHRRGGRAVADPAVYPDLDDFWRDLAAAYRDEVAALGRLGCTYLQVDDTSFASLCDDNYRRTVSDLGVDPDSLHEIYIDLFNDSLRDRPDDMTLCVHTCRGNYRGAWLCAGGYDFIAEMLFNKLDADGFFLEFDDERSGGFEPLRFVPKGKTIVLGLVSTKRGELETKDQLKRRIDEAAKFIPLEQLCLSPQCGFAAMADGEAFGFDEQRAKIARVVEVAHEVWG